MYIRHGKPYRRVRFGVQEDVSRTEHVFEVCQALQLGDLAYGDHPLGVVIDFVCGAAFLAYGTFSARGDVVTLCEGFSAFAFYGYSVWEIHL